MVKSRGIVQGDINAVKAILTAVCVVWNISAKDLVGRSRKQPLAFARQLAMALTYRMTSFSHADVGEVFGGREHATVWHAVSVIETIEEQHKKTSKLIEATLQQIELTN